MKQYRVIEDQQGGTFGMGRVYTASEWLEQALDWLDADGTDEMSLDDIENYYRREIAKGNEQAVIDYIAEMWQLEFEEISEEQKQGYKTYLAEFEKTHDKGMDPVCFAEWLDNEWEELNQ